jgi:GNAT superfamily N-acetyltransferase
MASVSSGTLRICAAKESDLPVILNFIRKLAEYERLSHEVVAEEASLRSSLFGENVVAEVILAYVEEEPVGFAVYFRNFSTFLGRPGIYLEDLFVEPAYRGRGIGKAIFAYIARIVIERRYGRLNWAVLDWNRPAIDFYKKLGAVLQEDWRICRLSGDALARLANG